LLLIKYLLLHVLLRRLLNCEYLRVWF
jgi:hypothetical protein